MKTSVNLRSRLAAIALFSFSTILTSCVKEDEIQPRGVQQEAFMGAQEAGGDHARMRNNLEMQDKNQSIHYSQEEKKLPGMLSGTNGAETINGRLRNPALGEEDDSRLKAFNASRAIEQTDAADVEDYVRIKRLEIGCELCDKEGEKKLLGSDEKIGMSQDFTPHQSESEKVADQK